MACAVGHEVIKVIDRDCLQQNVKVGEGKYIESLGASKNTKSISTGIDLD
jgi:hypothetical protein